jgi:hypothetical protein
MKTIIGLSILLLVALASVASCKLFQKDEYDLSAMLTLASVVSIILSVYILSERKINHSYN